ncbi:MAG: hypothetical protein VX498_02955 [Myxococcota bacterium]|nr:hypothetical protein [Myxococcota bacterium]
MDLRLTSALPTGIGFLELSERPAALLAVLLLLSLSLSGCPEPTLGPGSPTPPLSCEALPVSEEWIELGTGQAEFESIEPDEQLSPSFGGQGGFHIWTSLRGEGFHPGLQGSTSIPIATAEFRIVSEDGSRDVGSGALGEALIYQSGGQVSAPGNFTFLDQAAYDSIHGEESDFCDEPGDDDDSLGDDDDEPGELCGAALAEHLSSLRYLFSATLTDGCGNTAADSTTIFIDF